MPYCHVTSCNNGIRIFYRTYGHGPIKILLIIGLAGTHEAWGPQIRGIVGSEKAMVDGSGLDNAGGGHDFQICAFDNRGMGLSSVSLKKSQYTTTIMAKDAIALMDHLGWKKAHVVGHSMGGMIACKLASLVPNRIQSLALLNVTGGGFQCLPKIDRFTLSVALRFLLAKTPEERAAVDLDTHYSKVYLDEYVGQCTRREILYQEYVKGISKSGMQTNYGFEGQINACWTHKMTPTEIDLIRSTGFLISVIHGRHDIIANIGHAKKLAHKLHPFAKMVELHGGHLVSHERADEVNEELLALIKASESKISPLNWTNLHERKRGTWKITSVTTKSATEGCYSLMCQVMGKLKQWSASVFGIFVLAFKQVERVMVGRCKSVRMASTTPA